MIKLLRISNPYKKLIRSISKSSYSVGELIHGYEIKKVAEVPEFSMNAIQLEHKHTGSRHLHLEREDKNNVFNVLIRTIPMNDTGIAHILEHVVLCGSESFPVRDPFFKMLDRSMSNFMNAMTGSDYTMYPFATQNNKDFQNLMSVYLNAVFFPRIRNVDFLQEGWRLEHETVNDSNSPIIFKGVVFNEMKGYMANNSFINLTAMQKHLLPDHTYGYCSGGEPLAIPQLTWKELKDFHKDHFHPSKAIFMTYGDIPMEQHLEFINKHVMQRFDQIDSNTQLPPQQRWLESRHHVITCPPDQMTANPDKQAAYSVSYLLPEISDVYETFVASFVCTLLTDGPSAPLYKSLVESGVGSTYSPMTGYFGQLKEGVFSCGLQGIAEKDSKWIEETIYKTIQSTSKDGFAKERVDALLHQIELDISHQRSQFGLGLTFGILPSWSHGADPFTSLQVKNIVDCLRENLRTNPRYLQEQIEKYFLGNEHRLGLLMKVDEDYKEKIEKTEAEMLQNKLQCLDEKQKKEIFEQGIELEKLQNEVEDLSCLPSITLDDIPRKQENYESIKEDLSDIYINKQPTNGVSYFNAIIPINQIKEDLLPYVPLFCACLTEMGTKNESYEEFLQRQELFTGGLNASCSSHNHHLNKDDFETYIHLASHSLERNTENMFEMWKDLLTGFQFDNLERLQVLIGQRAQRLANGLSHSGHMYAMKNSARGLLPSAYYNEIFSGISQIDFMKSLVEVGDISKTSNILQQIGEEVFNENCSRSRFALNLSPTNHQATLSQLKDFINQAGLSSNQHLGIDWKSSATELPLTKKNHIELPLAVNFIGTSLKTVPYSHPHNPHLRTLARLMSTKFLHREIREKGGAYGSGAKQGLDGVWMFYSYRDPNVDRTLESFNRGIDWAANGEFTEAEMNEAKLAIFQTIDSPVSPSGRGLSEFSSGLDNQSKQIHRERIIDATKQQIVEAAHKYLKNCDVKSSSVIGPSSKDEANNLKIEC